MRMFSALAAAATLTAAFPATAVTYSLGTIDSGPVDVTSMYKPGYSSFNFDDGTSPFTGGAVVAVTIANQYVAPAGDTTRYFSVGPSTSSPATLMFSGVDQLSFYWGSIDTYNSITFLGLNTTFTGAAFGGTDSPVSRPSREVTFRFSPSESAALTGIRLTSSTNAFELDNLIFGSSVPEPASWAMLVGGIGAVGAALRRRRAIGARVAPAG